MRFFQSILKALWPEKIRGRLILGIALIQLVLMTAFVLYLVKHQKKFLKEQNHQQTFSFVNDYAVNSTPYVMANDFDQLERLTVSHINFPNLKYAMILSPEGVILAHTNTKYVGLKPADSISLQLRNLTIGKTLIEDEHILDIATPIIINNRMVGWARAGVGQDYIQNNLTAIFQKGAMYILLALLASTIFAVFIANRLSKGLYRLMSTADSIKDGDRNVRAPVLETFELSQLALAFNQMLDDISANEHLLGLVLENMPVAVWILDENGEIISGNSAGQQFWEGAKFVGSKRPGDYKAWHTETKQLLEPNQWASARAINKGERTINEEIEVEFPNGKRKTMLNSAIPLTEKQGKIVGAIAINVDTTERKKMVEQLALSESTLRSAFDHSAIGMAIVMPDGRFERVNKELCRILGYSEKELLETTFQQITHPDDLDKDLSYLTQCLNKTITRYRMEKRYFHKNGTIVWANLGVSLVRDPGSEPLFFVSQIEDIGDRKRSEETILHEKNLSDTIIKFMPGIFYLSDKQGNLLRWNADFESITGYNSMEVAKMKNTDFVDKRQQDFILEKRREAIATGKASAEVNLVTKTGRKLNYYVTVIPIVYNNESCILGMGVDFTERKKAESALVQKNMEIEDRVRELRCLYRISEMANDKNLSLDHFIRDAASYICGAFARPNETLVKIVIGNKNFQTPGFTETNSKQEALITVKGQRLGNIVVCQYKHENDETGEQNTFPPEKVSLINSIASIVSNAVEKQMADTELKTMADEFRAIIENTNESILLLSQDYKVLRFNKTAKERLKRVSDKEIYPGADFQNFLYPGSEEIFTELFTAALKGEAMDIETQSKDKNDIAFWLRTRMFPVKESDQKIYSVAVLAENITEKKKTEQAMIQFSRLFQFTSAINEMMLHAEDKQAIFSQACDSAVNYGKFSMAWIGNISADQQVKILAHAGNGIGYLETLQAKSGVEDFRCSPFATAILQRRRFFSNDIANEELLRHWKGELINRGFRSVLCLPIVVGSSVEGVFTFYRDEAFAFTDDEVKLLQELTNNIAYAVEKLELKELQKRAESELKESEEKFRKLVEETRAGVFILQDDRYVYVNPQFEKLTGYSRKELLNDVTFHQLVHEDDLQTLVDNYAGRTGTETGSDHYVLKGITKDRQVLPVEMIISPISYQGKPAVIGTVIDISEQVEEEKRINRAVTNAQEDERQQISMELHDNVKQMMAASLLNVDFLKMLVRNEETTTPIIDNIKNYMREAIEELRKISHRLAPSMDETVSLEEKIRTLVNTMNLSDQLRISYHFERAGEVISADVQLAMYRILQEQFTNILKHSNASFVDISIQRSEGEIRMSIEDNGIGFEPSSMKSGIGLENIKRRVQVHNGTYVIQTSPGKGCKLEVNIPIVPIELGTLMNLQVPLA
jgi:PAS domain S-box-containing protein